MHNALSAIQAIGLMREGRLTSVDLVRDCLVKIEQSDGEIQAWKYLDGDEALAEAARLDEIRRRGYPLGKLHGIPVGLKDIIDTRDAPAERGTPAFAGRRPEADAALAERLREEGAIILGKTVTTELAYLNASETRNPHNVAHTPGGSSSGSAAAVAACHVPLSVGTQTNGSVIRPASFCGVYGFKPTSGMISRRGLLQTSQTLDQVGVFARSLADVALLTDVLSGYDPADAQSYARPRPACLSGYEAEVPVEPDFVWIDMPYDDRIRPDARAGFEEVLQALDGHVERIPAPSSFGALIEVQRIIHQYEFCAGLDETLNRHWADISDVLKRAVERGREISKDQYAEALGYRDAAIDFFTRFYNDYDAVIAPAAAGEAGLFEDGTGDPIFCTIWTLCGLPCLSMPLLVGDMNLPIGVQLIGGRERDDRLFRTANWLEKEILAE